MKLSKLLTFMILLFVLVSSVHALGVTPSRKIIEFEPGEQEISFKIVNSQKQNFDVIIYPRGDLAKYVSIEENEFHVSSNQREVTATYTINLPENMPKPGVNVLEIVIEETISSNDGTTAIAGKIAVLHQLHIKVPYEGQYANVKFMANSPEDNKDLKFVYTLFNEGTERIENFFVDLEIYDQNSNLVATQNYEFEGLDVQEFKKHVVELNSELIPGKYTAKTKILYGGEEINTRAGFLIGSPSVVIEAISADNFKLGQINKMEILVHNAWYEPLEDLFAEVNIRNNNGNVFSSFKTDLIDLDLFSTRTLTGFWDTTGIVQGQYFMNINVEYGGKITEKDYAIQLSKDEFKVIGLTGAAVIEGPSSGGSLKPIIIIFILLLIINIGLIIFLRRRKKPPELLENSQLQTAMLLFGGLFYLFYGVYLQCKYKGRFK